MKVIKYLNNQPINNLETYLFSNNTIPIAIADTKMVVVAANDAANKLFKLTSGSLVGKTLYDLNANGTFAYDIEKLKKLLKGELESYIISRQYLDSNSEIIDGNLLVSLIEVEGEKYISGIFIGKNYLNFESGENNSKNYEMISTILSTSPDIQYIMDVPRRQYLYKNIDLLNFLGYNTEDLNDQKSWDFLKSKMVEDSMVVFSEGKRHLSDISKIGEFTDLEYKIKCKDGSYKWLRERSTPLVFGINKVIQYCYTIIQDVTDKRAVYEKVLDQQRLIEKVTSITPDIIFVYEINSLKNIYNNFSGRKFLGYTEYEWGTVGIPSLNINQQYLLNRHFDKLRKAKELDIIEDELDVNSINGEQKWIYLKSKVFKYDEDGFPSQILSLISDVSDFKIAIEAAENLEKTQRAVLEATPDLLLKIDRNGIYLEVIPSKLNDGYNPPVENMIGKSLFDVLSDDLSKLVKNEIDLAFELNEIRRVEFEREIDGKIFYLENHISTINNNEAVIIVRNVTNRKKMQQVVENKVLELSSKNIELEKYIAKNKELERFAYIVSHDLKEPLRTINAFSEIIKNKFISDLNDEAKTYFNFITSSALRMGALIDGILEYSKIEVNENSFSTEDTNDLLRKVLNDINANIKETNAKINFDNLHNVFCDPLQIRQLFQNLISNAIKFTRKDVAPIINIKSAEREKDIIFTVSDNGIGIDPSNFNTVFNMFKRLHSRDSFKGQGIGLALCKRIIERHGGDIWLESDGKTGTQFIFTIPKNKSYIF